MKKCKGCGEILQFEDKHKLGYAPNDSFEYCQRCFRLTHYGDTSSVSKDNTNNKDILKAYQEIDDALFVLIVDCFDALILDQDNLLANFANKDLLVVINKIDLLPKNVTEDKIEKMYLDVIKKCGNINVLLTYKNDQSFNELFFDVLSECKHKKVVFTGRANVGKSSLINKIIENNALTTSIYPGTTLKVNKINYQGYTFIDTAGLIDEESFLSYLSNANIKKILPLKTLRRNNFQLYENQSYFLNGLLRVDIKPYKNCSVEFMFNNNLLIHRSKLENAKRYFDNNCVNDSLKLLPLSKNDYHVDKIKTFYLKGLGIFKVRGECDLSIHVFDKIKIYSNEVNV